MTEISGTYDVAPNRCHCDAPWRIGREGERGFIQCTRCNLWVMNFEAVARWNEQRAEIERLTHLVSEYESRRALNLTDLATLQAELRSAAQENRRLQERCEWLARMERQQRWRALLAEMRIETTAAAHYQDI